MTRPNDDLETLQDRMHLAMGVPPELVIGPADQPTATQAQEQIDPGVVAHNLTHGFWHGGRWHPPIY